MAKYPQPESFVRSSLQQGLVIPAHPLALTRDRHLDVRHQKALTRYYLAAGAGGVAIGVHTTQFAIRHPQINLYKPVLNLAAKTVDEYDKVAGVHTVRIAGVVGYTEQAVSEAIFAREAGYHLGLLSLAALKHADDDTLIEHCRRVAREIPLMGFYLQPAAGGRILPYSFWRHFVEITNVVAIKIAPFNRYQTLDVVRALAESGRTEEIALYTGNDDNIVMDLLTPYSIQTVRGNITVHITGGLLGHWACWTRKAVNLLERCKLAREVKTIPVEMLALAVEVTDTNAAFFDAQNGYAGCIAGIHEVLRRQGLMENLVTLDPQERLSPGQSAEIDRVIRAYPHLNDNIFVQQHLNEWLD
jgi:dihydrodipicolinate synthase/N-acetylneuraminate lyase